MPPHFGLPRLLPSRHKPTPSRTTFVSPPRSLTDRLAGLPLSGVPRSVRRSSRGSARNPARACRGLCCLSSCPITHAPRATPTGPHTTLHRPPPAAVPAPFPARAHARHARRPNQPPPPGCRPAADCPSSAHALPRSKPSWFSRSRHCPTTLLHATWTATHPQSDTLHNTQHHTRAEHSTTTALRTRH